MRRLNLKLWNKQVTFLKNLVDIGEKCGIVLNANELQLHLEFRR